MGKLLDRIRQKPLWPALLGSFLVYLIPIYTVHISLPFGAILWAQTFADDTEIGWKAANIAAALAIQLLAAMVIYWCIKGPVWRWIAPVLMLPVLFFIIQFSYLLIIPSIFLIERVAERESGDWPVVCSIADAEVAPVHARPSARLESAAEVWLVSGGERYALLSMPDCQVSDLPIGIFRTTIDQVIPRGGAIYRFAQRETGVERVFVLPPGGAGQVLETPEGLKHWRPVLAQDGSRMAWLERQRSQAGTDVWIRVRGLGRGDERTTRLRMDRPASVELLALDGDRFLARRNGKDIVVIDADGIVEPIAGGPDIGGEPTQNFARVSAGWVGWEIYRDQGRHRIAWSLAGRRGFHEVPLGRGIRSVSASPDGRFLAVGVGPSLNIGTVKDSVYVLQAADGREIFRRQYARYTGSIPVFLGDGHLAMTVPEDGRVRIEVLRVPAAER